MFKKNYNLVLQIYTVEKLKTIELKRISLEEFKLIDKSPVNVVLDDIRSAHNVGSIFRICDAFLIKKLFYAE